MTFKPKDFAPCNGTLEQVAEISIIPRVLPFYCLGPELQQTVATRLSVKIGTSSRSQRPCKSGIKLDQCLVKNRECRPKSSQPGRAPLYLRLAIGRPATEVIGFANKLAQDEGYSAKATSSCSSDKFGGVVDCVYLRWIRQITRKDHHVCKTAFVRLERSCIWKRHSVIDAHPEHLDAGDCVFKVRTNSLPCFRTVDESDFLTSVDLPLYGEPRQDRCCERHQARDYISGKAYKIGAINGLAAENKRNRCDQHDAENKCQRNQPEWRQTRKLIGFHAALMPSRARFVERLVGSAGEVPTANQPEGAS